MKEMTSRTVIILIMCGLLLTSFTVFAKRFGHERVREAVQNHEIMPLKKILRIVEDEIEGIPIEIELEMDHHEWIYEIKILTPKNRIVELDVDARSGRILKMKRK